MSDAAKRFLKTKKDDYYLHNIFVFSDSELVGKMLYDVAEIEEREDGSTEIKRADYDGLQSLRESVLNQ